MKSKLLLCGFAFALLFTLGSCKSKESAYKAVYEKAQQQRPADAVTQAPVVYEPTPVPSADVAVRREKITTVEGSGLKRFSVVIGSFVNQTNASSLKARMDKEGYRAILALNQQDMYRVIVLTFEDRASAAAARDAFKRDHYPEFQDAWLLEQMY